MSPTPLPSTAPVLVTGAASGIGEATVRALLATGRTVWASGRGVDRLADLAAAGARTVALDVTDEDSMRSAVAAVEAEHGAVGALVNNAGYGEYGTVEEVPMDAVRREFETNVFGLSRMVQLVLPGMRRAGVGRIVNMGSMGGRLTFPAGGYYHASKHAVEAITDALRYEVEPFGVGVSLVEPGLIRTGFGSVAAATLGSDHDRTTGGPYVGLNETARAVMAEGYDNRMLAVGPERVAATVVRAIDAARPRHRYVVPPAARALIEIRRLGGSRVFDAYLRRQFATR